GEADRELALVVAEHVDAEALRLADPRPGLRLYPGAEQDQRRLQRERGEGVGDHPDRLAPVGAGHARYPGGHHGDAGGEVAEDAPQLGAVDPGLAPLAQPAGAASSRPCGWKWSSAIRF